MADQVRRSQTKAPAIVVNPPEDSRQSMTRRTATVSPESHSLNEPQRFNMRTQTLSGALAFARMQTQHRPVGRSLSQHAIPADVALPPPPMSVAKLFHLDAHVPGVPPEVVRVLVLANWNCVFMGVVEIVMELAMVFGWIPKVEFRLAFLFLTLLSSLLEIHTIADVQRDELDTTVQMFRISLLVEFGLIITDFEFLFNVPDSADHDLRIAYRAGFIVLTFFNVCFLSYSMFHLGISWRVFHCEYFLSVWNEGCCGRSRQDVYDMEAGDTRNVTWAAEPVSPLPTQHRRENSTSENPDMSRSVSEMEEEQEEATAEEVDNNKELGILEERS